MTELTLKLIIILIPGALGAIIFNKLIYHKEWSPFIYTMNSIIIGIFGYLFLQLFSLLFIFCKNLFSCTFAYNYKTLDIWNSISDSKMIPYAEVTGASFFCILLGFAGAYLESNKIINKIAQKFKVSDKYGDENLFSTFLSSKDIEFVYVRNIKDNLTYVGWVHFFSETDTISEIVLKDVKVYNYVDSELLYEIEKIYISFTKTDIIIEQAIINEIVQETESAAG